MWKYFWKYETDIPEGFGVAQFGPVHLAWVAVAVVFIIVMAIIYKKQSVAVRRRIELTISVFFVCGYVLRWIWAAIIGHYYPTEMLPLHLCSLSAMIDIAAIYSRKSLLKEFGYACGIAGGIVTFLMPGMGVYPVFHFYYLVFIMNHSFLILMPILWIWGDGFRPSVKRLGKVFLLLMGLVGVVVLVNELIGSNFMFLSYVPDGTPLTAVGNALGNPGYQFAMAGILFIVWIVLYTPWVIAKKKQRRLEERLDATVEKSI